MLLLSVTALIVIGLGAAPASAQGGCGPGFQQTTVSAALTTYPSSDAAIRAGDLNGDGVLCVKVVAGRPQFVDN
jgi:hypothetical protein